MKTSETVRRIKIQKKDLSGDVVYEYEGDLMESDKDSITIEALFTREDMPFMDVVLKKDDRFVEHYYSDRWYNIFEIYDHDDGKLKGWYCNVGMPAVIEDGIVSYVDLALDLWVSVNGDQTVLDEDEFEKLGLNEELSTGAIRGLGELKQLFQMRFARNTP